MNSTTSSTTLHVRRFIAAPRARVFRAFTTPDEMAKWMGPEEGQCRGAKADARVGGGYELRMKGCTEGGPEEMTVLGKYVEVRPPERLVFTWGWEGDTDPASQVTVEFFELDGGTDVQLTHERLSNAISRDRHTEGWTGSIAKLARFCAPGHETTPANPGCTKVGDFGWNELITNDAAASRDFYTQLFGWSAASFPGNADYTLFSAGSTMAGGMMTCPRPGMPSHWLGYVVVENCDASAKRAVELGGKLCLEPKDIPTVGRIAIFTDPQGAGLGLFQPEAK